jgi:hypothetical protein
MASLWLLHKHSDDIVHLWRSLIMSRQRLAGTLGSKSLPFNNPQRARRSDLSGIRQLP